MRVNARVTTAAAGGTLRAQYSVDGGSTWAYLTQAAGTSGGSTPNVSTAATGTIVGGWGTLHANAQIESAVVRIVGTATASATVGLGTISVETR